MRRKASRLMARLIQRAHKPKRTQLLSHVLIIIHPNQLTKSRTQPSYLPMRNVTRRNCPHSHTSTLSLRLPLFAALRSLPVFRALSLSLCLSWCAIPVCCDKFICDVMKTKILYRCMYVSHTYTYTRIAAHICSLALKNVLALSVIL